MLMRWGVFLFIQVQRPVELGARAVCGDRWMGRDTQKGNGPTRLRAVREAGWVHQLPGVICLPPSLHGVWCENRAIMRVRQLNLPQEGFDDLSPPRLALTWVPPRDVEPGQLWFKSQCDLLQTVGLSMHLHSPPAKGW